MQQAIMCIMAVGAVLGGLDRLAGNRFGLGKKFDEGFLLLGPTALSMAGILCLTPVLSGLLETYLAPLFRFLRLDPAMFAGILAIDMGGYPMAVALADDPLTGQFAGVVAAAIFGCTVSFSIPVGMGMLKGEVRDSYAQGMLYGLIAMPAALLIGGWTCGLGLLRTLFEITPLLLISLLLLLGLKLRPAGTLRVFRLFARGLDGLITVGLILGAVQYMTGFTMIPGLMPLTEAMDSVVSIGIVLLGSLPAAELIQRLLRKPLSRAGALLGVNSASMAGFLLCTVSLMPMLALMKDMDPRGRRANAAAAVCSTAMLAAHLGYTVSQAPEMLPSLLLAKLAGGVLGAFLSLRKSS